MGKQITPCPHCKAPIAIDYVDKDDLEKALEGWGKRLADVLPKPNPVDLGPLTAKVDDLCSKFPELCGKVDKHDTTLGQMAEAIGQRLPAGGHKITEQAWSEADDCPECRAVKEKIVAQAREGYIPKPKVELPYTTPPSAPKPAEQPKPAETPPPAPQPAAKAAEEPKTGLEFLWEKKV